MSVQTDADPLLDVRGLKKYFPVKKGVLQRTVAHVQAVDDVDLSIPPGGCLGLVGESGCGKTTTGRAILRLIEPDDGSVFFDGVDVVGADKRELRRLRREMQIILEDPFSSLNTRFTVGG
ncbi:MAG: ATP-binding cassette domain-containing protein, partial [Planctomycetota bacterium]